MSANTCNQSAHLWKKQGVAPEQMFIWLWKWSVVDFWVFANVSLAGRKGFPYLLCIVDGLGKMTSSKCEEELCNCNFFVVDGSETNRGNGKIGSATQWEIRLKPKCEAPTQTQPVQPLTRPCFYRPHNWGCAHSSQSFLVRLYYEYETCVHDINENPLSKRSNLLY